MFKKKSIEGASAVADQVVQSADHAIESTHRMADEALDSVRDASRQLQHQARRVAHSTTDYIRDDPLKAVLIAAATGAALMAVFSLWRHSPGRH